MALISRIYELLTFISIFPPSTGWRVCARFIMCRHKKTLLLLSIFFLSRHFWCKQFVFCLEQKVFIRLEGRIYWLSHIFVKRHSKKIESINIIELPNVAAKQKWSHNIVKSIIRKSFLRQIRYGLRGSINDWVDFVFLSFSSKIQQIFSICPKTP